jgi:4'-phosphopantetheinyl transferase EntD
VLSGGRLFCIRLVILLGLKGYLALKYQLFVISFDFTLRAYFPRGVTVVRSSASAQHMLTEEEGTRVISPFRNPAIAFALCDESHIKNFVLHQLEQDALGEAVSEKRRLDFCLGRAAARRALGNIGFPVVTPILRGAHREPIWPIGVVGSIAHGSGYGVAAVAWQQDIPALGIDIQKIEDRYTDELIARFADPDEFDWVRSVPSKRTERAVKLFSAKESVFKALYPLGKVWFAFDVAHLTPRADESGFDASVRLPSLSSGVIEMEVEVSDYNEHVITGALLSRPLS